jgi:hypothetical protein
MIGAMKPDSTVLYVNKAILDYTGFPPMILVSLTTSQVCRTASGWDRRFQLYPWPHTKRSGEGRGTTRKVTHGVSLQTALNLDPFMIHETFLCLTETAFGSHPCRVVSVTYRKLRPFHGGNTGSNPVGDANHLVYSQQLSIQVRRRTPQKDIRGAFYRCSLVLWDDMCVPRQHSQVGVT